MKALLIDSKAREVRNVTYTDWRDLKALIDGLLCIGWTFENGDVLFVDDEGLLKPNMHFFVLKDRQDGQPLAGNGVIVGADDIDADGNEVTLDVKTTVEELLPKLDWLSRAEVDRWGQENAQRPAVTFTDLGSAETTVIKTYGDIVGSMPRPQ